jgi:hypothetical protein
MTGNQYGRAQDTAVDTLDETFAAMKRKPLPRLEMSSSQH